jgi:hypothetical protein
MAERALPQRWGAKKGELKSRFITVASFKLGCEQIHFLVRM